jgi:hypothetical protein
MARFPSALVLVTLCLAPAARAEGPVVEEVVAVLKNASAGQSRVITLTKLAEEARIALVSNGAVGAAMQPLDGPALKAALEWLIDQMLLMDEVSRLQVFEVERPEVLGELKHFRDRFQNANDYTRFLKMGDLTEEELLVVLRRMLRVQRYLDSRVRFAGNVKSIDVEAYYRAHVDAFSGRSLEAVRDSIKAQLAKERIQAEVKSVVAELRSRADIRILEDFGFGGQP